VKGKAFVYGFSLCLILIAGCNKDNGVTPPAVEQLRILSVSPGEFALGAQLVPIEITGIGFTSVQSVDLGPGTRIVSTDVPDSRKIILIINVLKNADPGARTVTVATPSGSAQLANAFSIRNNRAPIPKISIIPDPGSITTVLKLDAIESTDDGTIADYLWEFSDGGIRHGDQAKYQFSETGTHSIRLTVTDTRGGVSTAEREIEILESLPPSVSFTIDPPFGTQNTTYSFDASASHDPDGTIVKYQWDFGDGSSAKGVTARHKFAAAGDYEVTLTLTDDADFESTETRPFTVKLFDVNQAIREINQVVVQFLQLFDRIETLSAEQIVVGFSRDPNCHGRNHEINIINNEKPQIQTASVQLMGNARDSNVTETRANADLTARFFGIHSDGTSYSDVFTHHFQMVNEGGAWRICNFTVD